MQQSSGLHHSNKDILPNTFPAGDHTWLFPGPVGLIEVRTVLPPPHLHSYLPEHSTSSVIDEVAVICHPHPLFQGSMQNKVVTTLAKAFESQRIPTVRFNFRGVGQSAGEYAEGVGEADDVKALLAWIKQILPKARIILAGFSFGGYVAFQVMQTVHVSRSVIVAPAVVRFDFSTFQSPDCPWLLVQGDADEIVDPSRVFEWVNGLSAQPDIWRMTGASHFFHHRLVELREGIEKWLEKTRFAHSP